MTDPVSRRDIASLADLRWLFERQLFSSRMALATRLVAAFPETTFVLVHAGTLEDTDPGTVETWRQGVRLLAEQSDVVVELTGQGTLVHPRRPGPRRPGHRHLPRAVRLPPVHGGGDSPTEETRTELPPLVAASHRALPDQPADVRDDVFAGTARRVHSL